MSINNNTTKLNELLQAIDALPDKSSGVDLPTLTSPASQTEVFSGKEYIDGSGNKKTGSFSIDSELSQQDTLIAQIQAALVGKAEGSGLPNGISKLDTGTITIASKINGALTVNHNLQTTPNFYFATLQCDYSQFNTGTVVSFVTTGNNIGSFKGIFVAATPAGSVEQMQYAGDLIPMDTDTSSYLNDTTISMLGNGFEAGATYRWVCGVADI